MERHPGIQASAECDSTMQPEGERKVLLSGGDPHFKKKGYYSNKKVFLIFNIKKNQLTKKRNLVNLNTRECSKKKILLNKIINNYLKLLNKIIYGEFDPGSG